MRLGRPFITATLAAFIALAAGVALAAPAAAAPMPQAVQRIQPAHALQPYDNWWACGPGNPGTQCDHTDPFSTQCANSKVYVASGNAYNGSTKWQVQLYYSTACHTIWSRLQLLSGSSSCFNCYLEVIRHNYDYSVYDTDTVGGAGQTIYNGAWTNQLYLQCGGSLKGYAELWHYINGTLGYSYDWYPGC